jgi:hypothetical protein
MLGRTVVTVIARLALTVECTGSHSEPYSNDAAGDHARVRG